jgi:hypothetical protein
MDIHVVESIDERPLNDFFGIKHSIVAKESFTDTYACLLNVFIVSKLLSTSQVNNTSTRFFKSLFKYLLRCEQWFIVKQATILLPYLGLVISNKRLLNMVTTRHEQTHVLSYYVLKALNFINLSAFMSYLRNNKFRCQDFGEYVTFVMDLLKNRNWLTVKSPKASRVIDDNKKFKQFQKRLLKIQGKPKTLRMSCVDVSAI